MSNIGKKIKELRIGLDLSQEELAVAAKTTKQTIHKYETGIVKNIPASKVKAIADKLKTTPSYLMGWEEMEKKNDAIADIILKLRSDNNFLEFVVASMELTPEQFAAAKNLLLVLKEQNVN